MKKLFLLVVPVVTLFIVSAGAQSVVDVAAQTRAKQKANPNARVIDNDILPSAADANSYGSPYETKKDDESAAKAAAKNDEKKDADKSDKKDQENKDDAKKDQGKPGAAADASPKISDGLKKQIDDQQKEIAQLQRELDVTQREARLRAAAYYADAGTMLRDQGKFAEDTRKTQADIDAKTQALAAAKQKLEDLQEDARKAGMPSSEAGNQ